MDFVAVLDQVIALLLQRDCLTYEVALDKPSAADAFQVRSVAQIRFVRRLGNISVQALQDVTRALATVLSIS